MDLETIILIAAGTLTGLHAGLLYDFSVNVVPSMRKLSAKRHIEMTQAIESTIVNPVFLLSFLGPIILLPLAALLYYGEPAFWWLVAAALVQILACCAVTVLVHLPLNAELVKVDAAKLSDAEAEKIRHDFQGPDSRWVRFHAVRTLAGITATVLMFVAAVSV